MIERKTVKSSCVNVEKVEILVKDMYNIVMLSEYRHSTVADFI